MKMYGRRGEVERRIKANDTEWVKHIVSLLNLERKVENMSSYERKHRI